MAGWEILYIRHVPDIPIMHVGPTEAVGNWWLQIILPDAEIQDVTETSTCDIRGITQYERKEFWALLNALLADGWQPFQWSGDPSNVIDDVTVVLRRERR